MYWNDIMSHKARTLMSKIRRQSRVRPYRERAEITPLLATSNGHKQNGNSTAINMNDRLYPIVEVYEGNQRCNQFICLYDVRGEKQISCTLEMATQRFTMFSQRCFFLYYFDYRLCRYSV